LINEKHCDLSLTQSIDQIIWFREFNKCYTLSQFAETCAFPSRKSNIFDCDLAKLTVECNFLKTRCTAKHITQNKQQHICMVQTNKPVQTRRKNNNTNVIFSFCFHPSSCVCMNCFVFVRFEIW
jgi:hypothetical protein